MGLIGQIWTQNRQKSRANLKQLMAQGKIQEHVSDSNTPIKYFEEKIS